MRDAALLIFACALAASPFAIWGIALYVALGRAGGRQR